MTLWSESMLTLHTMLLILAVVAFLLATFDVKVSRLNLMPLGLLFWVLAEVLVGR